LKRRCGRWTCFCRIWEREEIEPLVKEAEELERQKQMITVKKSDVQDRIKSIRKNKKETGETNQCPIMEGVKCILRNG
jgi:predicted nuclease with TOPRIM domain